MHRHANFWQVTQDALDYTLDHLKRHGMTTAILSNGSPMMLTAIAFQSSNAWDAVSAANFRLRVVWVNRFGQRAERLPFQADAEIKSLAELALLINK